MLSRNITATFTILALILAASITATPTPVDVSTRQNLRYLDTCEDGSDYLRRQYTIKPMTRGTGMLQDFWFYNGNDGKGIRASLDTSSNKLDIYAGDRTVSWYNTILFKDLSGTQVGSYAYKINATQECVAKLPLNAPVSKYTIEYVDVEDDVPV